MDQLKSRKAWLEKAAWDDNMPDYRYGEGGGKGRDHRRGGKGGKGGKGGGKGGKGGRVCQGGRTPCTAHTQPNKQSNTHIQQGGKRS